MAYEAIVIGVGAIVVAALIYWAKQDRHAREQKQAARETRIQSFADGFCSRFGATVSLKHLVEAGVLTLHDDDEIREACDRIRLSSNKYPIPATYLQLMDSVDLLTFFVGFAKQESEVKSDAGVRNLINSLKGTRKDA